MSSCERCAAPLVRRRGEANTRFRARRFCSVDCAIRVNVRCPRPGLRLLDWDAFAAAWNASSSIAEVATELGISHDQAAGLAAKLRSRAGVVLRRMRPQSSPTIDVFGVSMTRAEIAEMVGCARSTAGLWRPGLRPIRRGDRVTET